MYGMVMEYPTVVFRGPGDVVIEDRERPAGLILAWIAAQVWCPAKLSS
jgi:hypothetical protein